MKVQKPRHDEDELCLIFSQNETVALAMVFGMVFGWLAVYASVLGWMPHA